MSDLVIPALIVSGTIVVVFMMSLVLVMIWVGEPEADDARAKERWNKLLLAWRKLRRITGWKRSFFALGDLFFAYRGYKRMSLPGRLDNAAIATGFLTLGGVLTISILDLLAQFLEKM